MSKNKNVNSAIERAQAERGQRLAEIKRKLDLLVWIKMGFLIAIPLVYFLFSPLLLVAVGGYGAMLFVTIKFERKLNDKIPAKGRISIPKADSIVALCLIAFATFAVVCSIMATSATPSIYEGLSHDDLVTVIQSEGVSNVKQREEIVTDLIDSGATMPRALRYTVQELTLFSGTRMLFGEKYPNVMGAFGEQINIVRDADVDAVVDFNMVEGWSGWLSFSFYAMNIAIFSLVVVGAFWLVRTKYMRLP